MLDNLLARLRAVFDTDRKKNLLGALVLVVVFAGALFVDLRSMPRATVTKPWPEFQRSVEDGTATQFIRTPGRHVDYYHRTGTDIRQFVEIVDGFLDFLTAEFIRDAQNRRFSVFVSDNPAQHRLNSRVLFGEERAASFGTYYPKHNVLATHAQTGPGTITSLLVYPFLSKYASDVPQWARQAVATFFEKTYAFRQPDGRLAFRVGYQNPWRIAEVEQFDDPTLAEVIAGGPDITQSHYRLIGMFLWRHGRFSDFLARLQDRDLSGRDLAAAFNLPMNELERLWRDYIADVHGRRDVIFLVPVSQVFESEAEFQRHMNGLAEVTDSPPLR